MHFKLCLKLYISHSSLFKQKIKLSKFLFRLFEIQSKIQKPNENKTRSRNYNSKIIKLIARLVINL